MTEQPTFFADARRISLNADLTFNVPNCPIIPFIEGDGVGVDIMPVVLKVVDAAVAKVYGDAKKIAWFEVYAGEKARYFRASDAVLPESTIEAFAQHHVMIKGPLASQDSAQNLSINAILRQRLGLVYCHRPIQYIVGTPCCLKTPTQLTVSVFRQSAEVLNADLEWSADTDESEKFWSFMQTELHLTTPPQPLAMGLQIVSKQASQDLVRQAIEYAIQHHKPSVTLVSRAHLMPATEGAFKNWGRELVLQEFGGRQTDIGLEFLHPQTQAVMLFKDVSVEAFLQQTLLQNETHHVVVTLNRQADCVSDVLAAQVGGIGMVPTVHFSSTHALFEATHGSVPKHAGQDKVNPSSLILAAVMMLRTLGWQEAADIIVKGLAGAIEAKTVTYDVARLQENAVELSCSEFGDAIIQYM